MPRVLIFGQNPLNLQLLRDFLERAGYAVQAATDYGLLDAALEADPRPAAALLDLSGLDQGVCPRCERLRGLGIPFLIVSAWKDSRAETQGLSMGARAVLFKPLGTAALLAAVGAIAAAGPPGLEPPGSVRA